MKPEYAGNSSRAINSVSNLQTRLNRESRLRRFEAKMNRNWINEPPKAK